MGQNGGVLINATKMVQDNPKVIDLGDATGYTAQCEWTVNAAKATVSAQASLVDTTNDLVTSVAHGWTTAQKVQVSSSTTLPTGLSAATDYWLIVLSADTFAFATTKANALAGTKIDLTGVGTGNLTVTNSLKFLSASEVTLATDLVNLVAHGLTTGEACTLTTSSALPTGLATSTPYYVVKSDADNFGFASSLANANAGTLIDITGLGTGTQTVVLTALASASIKTEKSNDGVTYIEEEAATNITTTGSVYFGKGPIYYRFLKIKPVMASGNITLKVTWNSK